MYKFKNLISLILMLAICLSLVVPIGATNVTTNGGTAQTPVVLNVAAATFSVTVPTGLPVSVTADGTVNVATDAKIINNSAGPVKVVDMTISAVTDWTIANYETDLRNELVDSNQIGMVINNCQTTGADAIEFNADNFSVMYAKNDDVTDECPIGYNAKVSPLSEAFTTNTVANVVFTVDWDKAETVVADGIYYNQPYNLTVDFDGNGTDDVRTVVFFDSELSKQVSDSEITDGKLIAISYLNGLRQYESTYTIEDKTVTLTDVGLTGTLSDDYTQISVNNMGTFVLNTTPHDIYWGQNYRVTYVDGNVWGMVFYSDKSFTLSNNTSTAWSENNWFVFDGYKLLYSEDRTVQGIISIDGTQFIFSSGEVIETLDQGFYPNQPYNLTIDYDGDGSDDVLTLVALDSDVIGAESHVAIYLNGFILDDSAYTIENKTVTLTDLDITGIFSDDYTQITADGYGTFVLNTTPHDVYWGQAYSMTAEFDDEGDGVLETINMTIIFNNDGSLNVYQDGELVEYAPAGSFIVTGDKIRTSDINHEILGTMSIDGTQFNVVSKKSPTSAIASGG